jgi:hypothetical protein
MAASVNGGMVRTPTRMARYVDPQTNQTARSAPQASRPLRLVSGAATVAVINRNLRPAAEPRRRIFTMSTEGGS